MTQNAGIIAHWQAVLSIKPC